MKFKKLDIIKDEDFVWIKGYENLYKINKNGEILSYLESNKLKRKTSIIKTSKGDKGYIKITLLDKNGKKTYLSIHRLLMLTFKYKKGCEGLQVNHIIGSVSNLYTTGSFIHQVFQNYNVKIDLLIGGSPCQDLSIAGKRKGLEGERSGLFYEYVRILKEVKPKYFILENVASMSKEARDTITKELFGIEPVMINASLVSAQGGGQGAKTGLYSIARASVQKNAEHYDNGKSPTLTSAMGSGGGNIPMLMDKETAEKLKGTYIGEERHLIRKLTPIECERLQGLPDKYTDGISNTQRYKCLGNAFNVDVVTHILKNI